MPSPSRTATALTPGDPCPSCLDAAPPRWPSSSPSSLPRRPPGPPPPPPGCPSRRTCGRPPSTGSTSCSPGRGHRAAQRPAPPRGLARPAHRVGHHRAAHGRAGRPRPRRLDLDRRLRRGRHQPLDRRAEGGLRRRRPHLVRRRRLEGPDRGVRAHGGPRRARPAGRDLARAAVPAGRPGRARPRRALPAVGAHERAGGRGRVRRARPRDPLQQRVPVRRRRRLLLPPRRPGAGLPDGLPHRGAARARARPGLPGSMWVEPGDSVATYRSRTTAGTSSSATPDGALLDAPNGSAELADRLQGGALRWTGAGASGPTAAPRRRCTPPPSSSPAAATATSTRRPTGRAPATR